MAYNIYNDPNIVQELGNGTFKRRDGKVVDKNGNEIGANIQNSSTPQSSSIPQSSSTPTPKFNLFNFQNKVPGTNINRIIPNTTAIATSVKPQNNVYTPSSPASMIQKPTPQPVQQPAQPTGGIPGIPTANADNSLFDTYMNDSNISKQGKFKMLSQIQNGEITEDDANGIIAHIYGKNIPQQDNTQEQQKTGILNTGNGLVPENVKFGQLDPAYKTEDIQNSGVVGANLKRVANFGIGAINFMGSLGNMALHPADTLQSVVDTGAQGILKLAHDHGLTDAQPEDTRAIDAVGDYLKKYQIWTPEGRQEFQKQLDENPFSIVGDIASVASGGATRGAKLAELGDMSRTASVLNKTAEVANTLNPYAQTPALAGKVVGKTITGAKNVLTPNPTKPLTDAYDNYKKRIGTKTSDTNTPLKARAHQNNVMTLGKDLVENKDSLSYTDTDGNIVGEGRLPKSVNELGQATEQRKDALFNQYRDLEKQAGLDTQVDYTPVIDNLNILKDKVKDNPELQDLIPYIDKKIESYTNSKGTLDNVIEAKKTLNQKLKTFYSKGNYSDVGKDAVDLVANKSLGEILDDKINNSQYGELKQKRRAIKNLQEEIFKRGNVLGRQKEFGFFDLANPMTAMEAIEGIAKGSPLSLVKARGVQGMKWYMKYRNSPNTQIQEFFKNIEKRNKKNLSPNIRPNVNDNLNADSSVPNTESKPVSPKILTPKEKVVSPGDRILNLKNSSTIIRPKTTFKALTGQDIPKKTILSPKEKALIGGDEGSTLNKTPTKKLLKKN